MVNGPLTTQAPALVELKKASAGKEYDARALASKAAFTTQRAADRLAVSQQTRRSILAKLEAETEQQKASLQQETTRAGGEAAQIQGDTQAKAHQSQLLVWEQEAVTKQHTQQRKQSLDKVARVREHVERQVAGVDEEIKGVSDAASSAIETSRFTTRAKLDALKYERSVASARCSEKVSVRERESLACIDGRAKHGAAEVLGSEMYRHRLALSEEQFGDLAQAVKSSAQERVNLLGDKAAKRSMELAGDQHHVQVETDALILDSIRGNRDALQGAHGYCRELVAVQETEAAQTARKVQHLQDDAVARSKDMHRHVLALEHSRREQFKSGRDAVHESEQQLLSKRQSCDEELARVNCRLREIEDETQARVQQILTQWLAGSKASEQEIRKLEKMGRDAINQMQEDVNQHLKEALNENLALQHASTSCVAKLEETANTVGESTQAQLEAARHADDEATARALARFRELRPVPMEVEAAADAQVEAHMARAAEEEQRLLKDADAKSTAARQATKEALRDEKQLNATTAAVWAKLRKACYQLRLMQLHDFAEDIVSGAFDVRLPFDAPVETVDGLKNASELGH